MPEPVIALVSDAVLPYHKGGKETRIQEIGRRLAAGGAVVEVHTMRWWSRPGLVEHDGMRYRALGRLRPMYRGRRRSLAQAAGFALSTLRLAGRRFDVIDADAVPVVQVFTLWAVCAVRRRRLVVTWHEVWGKENWRRYLGRFLGPVAALLERWALALPDHILSPSHATAERIRSLVGTRVTVVPNGLDLATVDGVPADDEPFDVVYVGRLNAHKNVDALLRGIAHLQAGGAKVTCRILGTGSDDEALRDLAAELGVEHLVRFDGRVESDAAVIAAMKSARVFASLSEREGFGISVLEALACGRPVVAYDHPDNHARELLSHAVNGYLLMSLEPAEVAAALDWTLRNAATLAPHTAAATRAFDWDVIAARLREVYAR